VNKTPLKANQSITYDGGLGRKPDARTRRNDVSPRPQNLPEAFIDILAHLAAATSAYSEYVGRADRRGHKDPLYRTRIKDFENAVEQH
jgi:hypothetical protein